MIDPFGNVGMTVCKYGITVGANQEKSDCTAHARWPGKTGGPGGRSAGMLRISIKGLAFSVNRYLVIARALLL